MAKYLECKSIFMMLLLDIFSLGLYRLYWFWDLRERTRYFPGKRTVGLLPLLLYSILGLLFFVLTVIIAVALPWGDEPPDELLLAVDTVRALFVLLYLLLSFRARNVLGTFFREMTPVRIPFRGVISALLTFLFGHYYLQYKLNHGLREHWANIGRRPVFPLEMRCPFCKVKVMIKRDGLWICRQCRKPTRVDANGWILPAPDLE